MLARSILVLRGHAPIKRWGDSACVYCHPFLKRPPEMRTSKATRQASSCLFPNFDVKTNGPVFAVLIHGANHPPTKEKSAYFKRTIGPHALPQKVFPFSTLPSTISLRSLRLWEGFTSRSSIGEIILNMYANHRLLNCCSSDRAAQRRTQTFMTTQDSNPRQWDRKATAQPI